MLMYLPYFEHWHGHHSLKAAVRIHNAPHLMLPSVGSIRAVKTSSAVHIHATRARNVTYSTTPSLHYYSLNRKKPCQCPMHPTT